MILPRMQTALLIAYGLLMGAYGCDSKKKFKQNNRNANPLSMEELADKLPGGKEGEKEGDAPEKKGPPELGSITAQDIENCRSNKEIEPFFLPARVWLLSNLQYLKTVEMIDRNIDQSALESFPVATPSYGFKEMAANGTVTPIHAAVFRDNAEKIAAQLYPAQTSLYMPCQEADFLSDAACQRTFVSQFGGKLFREPLSAETITLYQNIIAAMQDQGVEEAIVSVVEALLQSPRFLYRLEIGSELNVADGSKKLSPYEIASLISYTFENGPPSAELLAMAESGELAASNKEALISLGSKIKAGATYEDKIVEFYFQLLDLEELNLRQKKYESFPNFNDTIKALMLEESRRFLHYMIFDKNASIQEILTSNQTFLNRELASYYGIPGVEGDQWVLVELGAEQRSGILTHGSFTATHSHSKYVSTTKRGRTIRERILCTDIAAPPPDVTDTIVVDSDEALQETNRDRVERHMADPKCASCHLFMDPLGYAFEKFNAGGVYAELDIDGNETETFGKLEFTTDITGDFAGHTELVALFGKSQQVANCANSKMMQYLTGETKLVATSCELLELNLQFSESGFRFKDHGLQLILNATVLNRK